MGRVPRFETTSAGVYGRVVRANRGDYILRKGQGSRGDRLAWIGWDKGEGTGTNLGKSLKGFDFGVKLCFLRRHDR